MNFDVVKELRSHLMVPGEKGRRLGANEQAIWRQTRDLGGTLAHMYTFSL